MGDLEVAVLFDSMAKILSNQKEIMRNLGISKHDSEWGWDDDSISNQINKCNSIASAYVSDC